jgi:hypothetical protein
MNVFLYAWPFTRAFKNGFEFILPVRFPPLKGDQQRQLWRQPAGFSGFFGRNAPQSDKQGQAAFFSSGSRPNVTALPGERNKRLAGL